LLPDFELPRRTPARSELNRAFHLKHRETRHLAAGLVEARPVSGSGEVKKRTGSFDYSPVRGFRVARCIAKAGPSL
jgi:hypothetical protein